MRQRLCLVAAGLALAGLHFLAESAHCDTPGVFVPRSGVGVWMAPRSGAVTRPEQNTWQAAADGFRPTAGTGLWRPGRGNARDPKADTWGPTTLWLPVRGRGLWFTPYSGSPGNPRVAQWERQGSSRTWVTRNSPGLWNAPSSGPTTPQTNTWRPVRAITPR